MIEVTKDYLIGKEAIEYVIGDLKKLEGENKISDIEILNIGKLISLNIDVLIDFIAYINNITLELSLNNHYKIIDIVKNNLNYK